MNEPLSLERFRDLADAYGGVISRWPERHRATATGMAAQPEGAAILEQASALDETLDAWRMPAPAAWLRDRVIGAAPQAARNLAVRAKLWWSGVGIAAALAGAVVGTAAVASVAPADSASDGGTSFGDVAGQDS